MRYMAVLLIVIILGGVLYIAQTATTNRKEQGDVQDAQTGTQRDLERAIEIKASGNLPNTQAELEEAIKKVFLRCGYGREIDDTKERLEELGSREELTDILRKMVAQHQYAQEESLEFVLLNGATWMLGEMSDKQAADRLSQMVFDLEVHENVRALAVKGLGNIDAESYKELLLQALYSDKSYNHMIRVYAAEGLARLKDEQVLAALEQAAQEESDSFIREKFQAAAQEVRSKP